MGEPAAAEAVAAEAAAAGVAASERDVLLATKLNVPGLRPDLVPRPRLAQRLDEGRGRGLVLACAPAGYGKTVLLAEWVRRGRRPVAWLSLDAGDNDPARFWRHAVALFLRFVGTPAEQVDGMRGAPFWPGLEAVAPTLAYDHAAILGEPWSVPAGLAARVSVPALVMAGDASLPFMPDAARVLSQAIPRGQFRTLKDQTHEVNPGVLAPVLVDFFTS